jgi:hypothetical protein
MNFFLQSASLADSGNLGGVLTGGILAAILGLFIVFALIAIVCYIYMGFAYSAIARKNKQKSPGLAWIPFVGPVIIAYKASKMSSWPWFLLFGILIGFLSIIPIIGVLFSLIYTLAMITFGVFSIIWHWKMFEAVDKPGWWAILMIIWPIGLIMVGIAAWSKK